MILYTRGQTTDPNQFYIYGGFVMDDNKIKEMICAYNAGAKKLKWNDIFKDEDALIEALFDSAVLTPEETDLSWKWCKGYGYIQSFRKYYKKNGMLTEKQMAQLKRIAINIAEKIYC